MTTIVITLSDEDKDDIAARVVALLAPREEAVSVDDAARRLGGISERSVWRHIAAGRLRSRKVGGRTVVLTESIDRLLGEASP